MDKRKQKFLLFVSVGVVFVVWRAYALANKYFPATASAGVYEQSQDAPPSVPLEPAIESSREDMPGILEAQARAEQQSWGHDPFDATPFQAPDAETKPKPIVEHAMPAPAAPPVAFTGVSKAGDRWLAAVNGNILTVGDVMYEKFKVVRIGKSSITLATDHWSYTYELGEKLPSVHAETEHP